MSVAVDRLCAWFTTQGSRLIQAVAILNVTVYAAKIKAILKDSRYECSETTHVDDHRQSLVTSPLPLSPTIRRLRNEI
jgi:hypothetical protein